MRPPSVGGGIYLGTGLNLNDPFAKAVILSNSITGNTSALDGAGIYVDAAAVSGVPSVVEITDNQITTNTAGDGATAALGGGIAVITDTTSAADRSVVTITGNVLDGNVAKNATVGGNDRLRRRDLRHDRRRLGIRHRDGHGGGEGSGNTVRNNVSEGIGGGISVSVRPGVGGKHTGDRCREHGDRQHRKARRRRARAVPPGFGSTRGRRAYGERCAPP